jgi:hypothetical protein
LAGFAPRGSGVTTLSILLSAVRAVLQAHPLCQRINAVETREFSAEQFYLKIKADLTGAYRFQVRIYFNRGHIDYAYQLYTTTPLLRWDNKEEFQTLTTYPHHHHDEKGNVYPSPLSGEPQQDLEVVLRQVTLYLDAKMRK